MKIKKIIRIRIVRHRNDFISKAVRAGIEAYRYQAPL